MREWLSRKVTNIPPSLNSQEKIKDSPFEKIIQKINQEYHTDWTSLSHDFSGLDAVEEREDLEESD